MVLQARAFLADGAEYEATTDVTRVVEITDQLWIVEYETSQFLTGFGEILDSSAAYVSSDGLIGGRVDPDDDEPGCFDVNRNPDPATETLRQQAASADQPEGDTSDVNSERRQPQLTGFGVRVSISPRVKAAGAERVPKPR